MVAVDILGPLPEMPTGNKYILVAAGYFTRWTEAYGIPNQEATTVATKLVEEETFLHFSLPVPRWIGHGVGARHQPDPCRKAAAPSRHRFSLKLKPLSSIPPKRPGLDFDSFRREQIVGGIGGADRIGNCAGSLRPLGMAAGRGWGRRTPVRRMANTTSSTLRRSKLVPGHAFGSPGISRQTSPIFRSSGPVQQGPVPTAGMADHAVLYDFRRFPAVIYTPRYPSARLMTIPGIGPVTAMAIQAFAPPMENFRRGRDFSAWLGLVPRQHTTGGKPRLGRISKMGQRDLRRLLVTGAMAVVQHASRRDEAADPWLAGMLARKPKKLVAVALANRTARRVWALATRKETYRVRAAA